MVIRLFVASALALLCCPFGLQLAHADIYTWVDASGTINVSNLSPPDGVSPSKVIHESTSPASTGNDKAREAAREAQVESLSMRVGQLEDELEFARRQMPPPIVYPVVAAPPVPMAQYVTEPSPPLQYADNPAPYGATGCDPSWVNCAPYWGPGVYPASVVVLWAPYYGRPRPYRGHQFAMHPQPHVASSMRKG